MSDPLSPSVITGPTDAKLSFFGRISKKLKGKHDQEKKEATHVKLHNAKEDEFEAAHRGFNELEQALIKLNDHTEKHLHAMQEACLYQQMISNDFTFFYCSKGSYFAKCGEEYKQKCTEHLKHLSSTVFPALVQHTLQPIRTQLAALPDIKELLAVRAKQKHELEAYRHKVGTLRKAAGLSEAGAIGPAAMSALPSNVSSKLGKKITKLGTLTAAYERMHSALLESLVKYVNSKDLILNSATRAYLDTMQEYSSKNLILHTADVKLFMKNLQATSSQVKLGASAAAGASNGGSSVGHRKSNSVQFSGFSTQQTRHPYASFSSATMPRASMFPLQPDEQDDIEEAEQNPLALSKPQSNTRAASNPAVPTQAMMQQQAQAHATVAEDMHDPSSLLSGFGKLRAEALARDQRKLLRRASGLINLAVERQHGSEAGASPTATNTGGPAGTHAQRHSLVEALGSAAPLVGVSGARRGSQSRGLHRASYSVFLYNNPPFLPAEESSFERLHTQFSPATGTSSPIPAAIETTSEALRGLCHPRLSVGGSTIVSALPLKDLVDAAPRLARTSSLDTKSHLASGADERRTIPIVSTAAFLQQHRADQTKRIGSPASASGAAGAFGALSVPTGPASQPGSRRTSNATLPAPASPKPGASGGGLATSVSGAGSAARAAHTLAAPAGNSLRVPGSSSPSAALGASPLSPSTSLASSASASALSGAGSDSDSDADESVGPPAMDDDPDYIPPPPEPIDWDQITDSSSGEESEDDAEEDEREDEREDSAQDQFLTPRSTAEAHSRAASSAFGFAINTQPLALHSIDEASGRSAANSVAGQEQSAIVIVEPAAAAAPSALPLIESAAPPSKPSTLDLPTSPAGGGGRASVSLDGGARGKPILTGKFAALTATFGNAGSRSASVSIAPQAMPALATQPAAPAASSSGSTAAAPKGNEDATPLPTFESSPVVSAAPAPSAAANTVHAVPLQLDDGADVALGASMAADLEAVFRMAAASKKAAPASTPAAAGSAEPAAGAAPVAEKPAFRSPFMRQPEAGAAKSPFTIAGAAKSPFLSANVPAASAQAPAASGAAAGSASPAASLQATTASSPPAAVQVAPAPAPIPAASPPPPPPAAEILEALYDYPAQRDCEISFKKGDLITVVSKDASGWFTGIVAGETRSGVFPSNFCQPKL